VSVQGSTPPGRRSAEQPHNIATAIADVSERASLLVREEIELAKAEVTEKATKLVKGAVVAVVAGVFFMTALVFALVGCAWLLYYYLPGNNYTFFWGFFAMAVILVLLGTLAGLVAARAVKRASPPVPNMAIEEARKIREAVSATAPGAASSAGAPVGAAPPSEPPPAEAALVADAAPVADVEAPAADSDAEGPASFDDGEAAEGPASFDGEAAEGEQATVVAETVVAEAVVVEAASSSDTDTTRESASHDDSAAEGLADAPGDGSTEEAED
jgi:Putative Actinobacterial Holin-X, holin superfamily III